MFLCVHVAGEKVFVYEIIGSFQPGRGVSEAVSTEGILRGFIVCFFFHFTASLCLSLRLKENPGELWTNLPIAHGEIWPLKPLSSDLGKEFKRV